MGGSIFWLLPFLVLVCLYLTLSLTGARNVRHQRLSAPHPRGCAFGNATEFCPCLREAASAKARRTCSCQAKDKIRLPIQKLEGSVCGRRQPRRSTNSNGPSYETSFLMQRAFCKVIIAKTLDPYWDTLREIHYFFSESRGAGSTGNETKKVEPLPITVSNQILPFICSMACLLIAKPRPEPECLVVK